MKKFFLVFTTLIGAAACSSGSPAPRVDASATPDPAGARRLPTGARLDPAGVSYDLGSMPLAMSLSPDKSRVVVLLNGWREQGIQIVDRISGQIVQKIPLPAVFLGLVFSPDGKSLYVSGGNEDAIYRFNWQNDAASFADTIRIGPKLPRKDGVRYPAGIAISPSGRTLYVAENLGDSVAVLDLVSKKVVQRLPTERYPYGVVVSSSGEVYLSAWGGSTVSVFASRTDGLLSSKGAVRVGRHPSALAFDPSGLLLYVASGSTDRISVVSTRTHTVVGSIDDGNPAGVGEGSTPNALAFSPDGTRLFVAEADNNAVGVFDIASGSNAASNPGMPAATLVGRIPVWWYPSALAVDGNDLLVVSGKGKGTAPNVTHWNPGQRERPHSPDYTLGQINGTLSIISAVHANLAELTAYSSRVATANGWNAPGANKAYPPFEHVIYIIKENRTYDQMLGDLPGADGDPSLVFFGRGISPNHHALAERFGIFDRFFVNAEASPDGHNWSTSAYVTDYGEKTIPSHYSSRGRTYDYEGWNRDKLPDDDVAQAANGYLWDLAEKAGITYRNYGEFVDPADFDPRGTKPPAYVAAKRALNDHTNHDYAGFSLEVSDQHRVDVWLAEFQQYVAAGTLPRLEIMRLPNDHTSGASGGRPTPRAYVADNDLALGRLVEALSKSPYWKNTVVFVLEDDAQDGPDHVDSHRSPLFVISAYNTAGVIHRFANTTDVLATIEEILGLGRMSQFDQFGRPLREIWSTTPDLSPYVALTPSVPLNELNPKRGALAEMSKKLALKKEDEADEELFNRILWRAIKGDEPYPGTTRMSALEAKASR